MNQITVTVKLYSTLQKYIENYDPTTGVQIVLPEGAIVEDLIRSLGLPLREALLVIVRNAVRKSDYRLIDGDAITVFSIIGGG